MFGVRSSQIVHQDVGTSTEHPRCPLDVDEIRDESSGKYSISERFDSWLSWVSVLRALDGVL